MLGIRHAAFEAHQCFGPAVGAYLAIPTAGRVSCQPGYFISSEAVLIEIDDDAFVGKGCASVLKQALGGSIDV